MQEPACWSGNFLVQATCRACGVMSGSLFRMMGVQDELLHVSMQGRLSWAYPNFLLWVPACIKCEVAVAILQATS